MDSKLKLITDTFGTDKVKLNVPLSDFTALKLGGPAKLFFIAFTQAEIIKLISFCRTLKIPFFIFGTGTKIMMSDNGFNGVVIKNRTRNIKILSIKGKVSKIGIGVEEVLIEVESGVSIDTFIEFLKHQGLAYIEFESISGSIGGNLFLNQTLQNRLENIKVLNENGKIEEIKKNDLNLRKHVILSAVFKIKSSQ